MVSNYLKTGVLLAALSGVLLAMGAVVGGQTGLVVAFVVSLGINLFSLWKSDKMVLSMHGAQEVDAQSAPDFYRMVEQLAGRAGLPMPRVYIMHNDQPNAFATGRSPSNAAVCASTGLLEMLSPEEVAGVMAHELAHIQNRDTLIMTVAASIGGAISMVAQMMQFGALFGGNRGNDSRFGLIGVIVAALVAPFAAMIIQMAISRSREYKADSLGAQICGNPRWLSSALARIEAAVRGGAPNEAAEAAPATAHLFIINPLTGRGMDNLFSTHPNTANRIAALEELASSGGFGDAAGIEAQPSASRPSGPWSAPRAPGRGRGPWG